MDWMYKNSSESVDREEYLLGRAIDKNFESQLSGSFNEVDKDITPASIFSNTGSNLQVDVVRKLKEDPLEQIRQKELETRKQLLKNPVKLKKLQNMLKANRDKQEKILRKKAKKKRKKSEDKMIDELLTSKFLQMKEKLGGKKLADLGLEGRDRKHNKDVELRSSREKKKKKSKSESSDTETSSSSSSSEEESNTRKKHGRGKSYVKGNSPKRETDYSENKDYRKKYGLEVKGRRDWGSTKADKAASSSSISTSKPAEKVKTSAPLRKRLTEEEKAERLKEMTANAEWRSHLTTKNYKRYKEEQKKEKETSEKDFDEGFFRRQMALATSDSTVQQRIKSNVNKIQRSEKHMYENFARR
ncbi:hypothetical protein O3M35_005631 [Rhynocoris fuscipes]|uniref:Pre-mRNA-splicing factor CWC25 homolog n=1 Tax=Rhynocoris fuscipes TaxID=488301 RepID=A0AAW1DIX5_9HEMI